MKHTSLQSWLACACIALFCFARESYCRGFSPVFSDSSHSAPVYRNLQNPVQAPYQVPNPRSAPASHYASRLEPSTFDQKQYFGMSHHPNYQRELVVGRPQDLSSPTLHKGTTFNVQSKVIAHPEANSYGSSPFHSRNTVTYENNMNSLPYFPFARSDSYYNNDGSQFYSNDFGAGSPYSFSNDDKWTREDQFSTITTVTVNGEYFIIGRGSCGIRIVKVGNNGVELVNDCDIPFSNEKHWDRRSSYETISAEVVNGHIYIVGRGSCGMLIYKVVGNSVENISSCEIPFSDMYNWDKERYYRTIQTAATSKELYVIGRGVCGMHIFKVSQDKVHKMNSCDIPFSDFSGWSKASFYETITSAVFNNEVYVMGRNPHGMVVYRTTGDSKVEMVSNEEIPFSNGNEWNEESHYETIQAHADSEGIFVLGRARSGIVVYKLVNGNSKIFSNSDIVFSDGRGWGKHSKYSTIGSAVVHDDLYVWGLESCGMKIYKVSKSGAELVSDCIIPFSQSNFFDRSSCYRTVRGAASQNGLVITGRAYCGMSVYDNVESKIRQRAICV